MTYIRRCLSCVVILGVATLGGPAAEGQEPVGLLRWSGRAALVPNPGPGETFYRLRAAVGWPEGAERSRLGLAVALPDGRVDRQGLRPGEGPGSSAVTVLVPANAVRDLLPEAVRIEASLVDLSTGLRIGEPLAAGIERFPRPESSGAEQVSGPFGWGVPLDPDQGGARPLPQAGPEGLRFVRVVSTADRPGFFVATTEASNAQVAALVPGYDPDAGRSDEFVLDGPDQPALGLDPARAEAFLASLTDADASGVVYRLPTRAEWDLAARAGEPTAFWWGDAPVYPEGANFLGPEPGAAGDTTAPVGSAGRAFTANPWGLMHTFGNVAEWATSDDGSTYARMGGHFRSEPTEALDPPVVSDPAEVGGDPFVGGRPAFDLDAEEVAARCAERLAGDERLTGVAVSFDPDRVTATLTGTVAEPADRLRAAELLRPFWFLAAVEDLLEVPTLPAGRLAGFQGAAGPARPFEIISDRFYEVPIAVEWAEVLPVAGSRWWLNIEGAAGRRTAQQLDDNLVGRSTIKVVVPARLLDESMTVRVVLSLGEPAAAADDPRVVSGPLELTLRP